MTRTMRTTEGLVVYEQYKTEIETAKPNFSSLTNIQYLSGN